MKWSDHAFHHPNEVKPLVAFCTRHDVRDVTVTTRTADRVQTIDGLTVRYQPASMHAFVVGQALVHARNEDLQDDSRFPSAT